MPSQSPMTGRQPHKMVKQTQTIRRQQPTNCLSVFDYFMGLALKWLKDVQHPATERLLTKHLTSSHIEKPSFGGVLKTFTKFMGKHLCQRLFFNKVAGLSLMSLNILI